jgi:class I fructose-bisphosphate aldolase
MKKSRSELALSKLMPKGKAMFLAYDQGLEHGPIEFNNENVDPLNIINIAQKGKFSGIIFQKGIAEKYKREIKKSKVPLIIKLNGKTSLFDGEPISKQLCTIEEAISLGASAVGYTIYIGSEYEPIMMEEFENIERQAHASGLPVIAWIYPRGKSIKNKSESELLAYSARVALEIGADVVKLKPTESLSDLKWAVKSAGRCKVVFAGGEKTSEQHFLKEAKLIMKSKASGIAVGRNIWQHPNPIKLSKELKKIVFK